MADEKAIEMEQESITPTGVNRPGEELSEEDLRSAEGGRIDHPGRQDA